MKKVNEYGIISNGKLGQKVFEFIHYTKGSGKDIVDNNLSHNCKCDIDKKNKEKSIKVCLKLKEYNISNREIAKLIGIDRNKVD